MATQPSTTAKSRTAAPAAPEGREAALAARQMAKGLGAVVIRNEFYRDGYRVLQSIAVMQAIIICVLVFIMFYVVHIHQPENRYFATTEDGRLVPMVALSEPNLNTPALTSWVAQAAAEAMTFGFNDYRQRLQEASRNFTRTGWASFTTAMEDIKYIQKVESGRLIVTAIPSAAPVVIEEGLVQGRYQWTVQLRLTTSEESLAAGRISAEQIITLIIVRVPRLESPSGVGIERWIGNNV